MVSARTAAFFALFVAVAPHILASPLPAFDRVERGFSQFSTLKAYERRALSNQEYRRSTGVNTMPEEMPTKSDGVTMKMYESRAINDGSDVTTSLATGSAAQSVTVPAEVATSSDGSGPVPITKRASGINTMPAEVATMSDGITMKVFERGLFSSFKPAGPILPDPVENAGVSDNVAVSSDGSGPVPFQRRETYQRRQVADGTDPADTTGGADTSIGADTTAAAILPSADDVVNVPAEVAVSSDGSGPVAIQKRATGINTMPAEVATMSDGITMKVFE